MAWYEPKKDWLKSDYFLLEDWNRIVANAQFLYELFEATFDWRDCQLADTAALPYYDLVNNLENNLLDLCKSFGFDFVKFEATTWHARTSSDWTHNPSAEDFSRWENLEHQLHMWHSIVTNPQNVLRTGTLYSSTNRVTQMLSRGR